MGDSAAVLRRLIVPGAAAAIFLLALATRMLAVSMLLVDFDEDDYLRAGQQYATGFQHGDLSVLLEENYRPEHPPLSKIVTGLAITPLPPAPEIPDVPTDAGPNQDLPQPHLDVARTVTSLFGAATAGLLALVSPLGGLWLALHTWSIKYTAQVMLEAVPAFLSLLAVMLSTRAWRPGISGRRRAAWLAAAAIAFGMACAGKYMYGVAGLAIVADWLLRVRAARADDSREPGEPDVPAGPRTSRRSRQLLAVGGFLLLAFGAFLLADPYLWPDPVGRLTSSLTFHAGYAQSAHVQETGWPMWQPLVWLSGSIPVNWQPEGTFVVAIDIVISALAVAGLRRLWTERRVYALWLLIAFVFLLAWPTKWPQYVLVLSTPLCLAAGLTTERLARSAATRLRRIRAGAGGRSSTWRDVRTALPWLVPGIVGLLLLALIPLTYEFFLSLTDMQLSSLKDGLNGGVMREAIGGLTGQIAASPYPMNTRPKEVSYVGFWLLNAIQQGFSPGGQTTAAFVAFSVLWMVLVVGLQAAVGIAVALVLERPGTRHPAIWRTLFILPWAIPEVVGAVAWRDIVHPEQGLIAQATGSPFPWPASPELSLLVLLVAGVWMGWPLWMLVATAGLRTIPRAVHEAATLDGAGGRRRFTSITLPLLLPLLGAAFIVRGIAAFNQFYLFWILGPNGNDYTLATWSYSMIRGGTFTYSISAAVNIVTVVGLGVVVAWFLRWRTRVERVAFA